MLQVILVLRLYLFNKMSVKPCNRVHCENIMCDRYSGNWGYICDSCFDELVTAGIDVDIESFMAHKPEKQATKQDSMTFWSAVFRAHA